MKAMLDSNSKLLGLAIQLDAYSKDQSQSQEDKVAQTATASLSTAIKVQGSTISLTAGKNPPPSTSPSSPTKPNKKAPPANSATPSPQTALQSIDLDKIASEFQGELADELARLVKVDLPQDELWKLIPDANKAKIRDELKSVMAVLLANNFFHLEEKDLAAFIVMPGGNGQMYFPDGLFVRPSSAPQTAPRFSIPLGYGASGLSICDQ